MKRKGKFTNCSSREIDKRRKTFIHDNFGEDEKHQLKKKKKKKRRIKITSRKKKKANHDNLDNS